MRQHLQQRPARRPPQGHEQPQRHPEPHPVRRAQQRGAQHPPGMVVPDRGAHRRSPPRHHREHEHRAQRGGRRAHRPVGRRPAARHRGPTGGQQRDQQHGQHPQQPAEQRGPGAHREADGGLGVRQVGEPVGQAAADVADVAEARDLQGRPLAPGIGGSEAESAAVEGDGPGPRPREPAEHQQEEHGHRPRPRGELAAAHGGPRAAQRPGEDPAQEQRPHQAHAQRRDVDGGVRPRARQAERLDRAGRGDRTADREHDHRGGHRAQRARGVRPQQMQPGRRDAGHREEGPAHRRDRGEDEIRAARRATAAGHGHTAPRSIPVAREADGPYTSIASVAGYYCQGVFRIGQRRLLQPRYTAVSLPTFG